jgi:N-glycosylase/DNA lyase
MRIRLDTPPGFDLRATVLSHGWCRLDPFRYDEAAGVLETVVAVSESRALPLRLYPDAPDLVLEVLGRPEAATRRRLAAASARMLNLDLDLSGFHDTARGIDPLAWIAETGAGRLLRSPTLFEDLVKLVLTTNCSWAFTTRMVRALVRLAGTPCADGRRAFPTPVALAALGEARLRDGVRAGYRAPLLAALADRVASGEVDPEGWEHDTRPAAELRRELLELPGVGAYVAENMLRLLGRPCGLALDSWLRATYSRLYHEGRQVTDRTIGRRYARCGGWAGLALWCDLTREWTPLDL